MSTDIPDLSIIKPLTITAIQVVEKYIHFYNYIMVTFYACLFNASSEKIKIKKRGLNSPKKNLTTTIALKKILKGKQPLNEKRVWANRNHSHLS